MATISKVIAVTGSAWTQLTNGDGAVSIRPKFSGGVDFFVGPSAPELGATDTVRAERNWINIRDLEGAEVWAKSVAASNSIEVLVGAEPTVDVTPRMASGGNTEVATSGSGESYTAFGSQACSQLTIVNDSGTAILWRQGGAGVALAIPDGQSFTIFGVSNANQIEVRRKDGSNTPVTIGARWEA